MCMGVLCGFMCVHQTHGVYKKVSILMELEFLMVASYYVGAGNRARVPSGRVASAA